MEKILVIKFGGKLGDTVIGISPFLFKHDQTCGYDFLLQNVSVVDFIGAIGLSAKKIPKLEKNFKSKLRLLFFLAGLPFLISKYTCIYLLESKSSWWYKILSLLIPTNKIITPTGAINAYAALKYFNPKNEKSLCDLRPIDIRLGNEKGYICIGVGVETWEYRGPSIHTWIQFCKMVLKNFPEYKIQFLGSGPRELEFVDKIKNGIQSDRLVSNISLKKMELTDLLPIISGSHLNIMVDSGLAHFCNLVSTPEIFIFGPDTPEKWFPFGRVNRKYFYFNPGCSPCPQNWLDQAASCQNFDKGKCTNSRLFLPTLLFMLHQSLNRS